MPQHRITVLKHLRAESAGSRGAAEALLLRLNGGTAPGPVIAAWERWLKAL